jgi:V/A-type H+/Na+-transporting ATPase subunit G/H
LAKEKTAHAQVPPPTSHSAVETIVGALSELEGDIDGLYIRVEEMKKRIMAHSNEEVEKLKQQVIAMANEEAKQIVDSARAEAESESEKIGEMGRANVANLKKNINSSFDAAVDSIVRTVLGDTTPAKTSQPSKAKKFTPDGKPVG